MSTQPNILIVMTDQQKATASHLYGNTFCETPNMARLASQGVLFEHAFTPHPLCVPARVSFWTGQWPHSHGGRRNETMMPAGATHGIERWKEAGYHVGLIGKNHCFNRDEDLALFDTYCEISHVGLPEGVPTKGMEWFRPIEGINAAHALRRSMPQQNPRFGYAFSDFPLEDYSTGLVAGQTERFLEKHAADPEADPFALWVSIPDPHEPWDCPAEYAALFPKDKIELPPWRDAEFNSPEFNSPEFNSPEFNSPEFSDAVAPERNRILYEMLGIRNDDLDDVYGVMAAYYGMVRFLDDGLGQILDALDRHSLREETIVLFCSDHGDFMGEHAMQCKGGAFYDCLTRVPLIVSVPEQFSQGKCGAGHVDSSMVNLIDVIPTLLTLQGIEVPRSMHGQPLPSITDSPPRDATFSEYGAGGPQFRLSDLQEMPKPWGRRTLIDTLSWREAEGRRKMVRTREWKYVHDPMGDLDELYDMVNDPWELTNVAAKPEYAGVISEMQVRLADWMIRTEDALPIPLP